MRSPLLNKFSALLLLCGLLWCDANSQGKTSINIQADKIVSSIQPTMWGVFFEDINMGADGGLYAEMIKNRSFEFFKPLMGWKLERKPFVEGAITIQNQVEKNKSNPRFMRVQLNNAVKGSVGMTNEGFRGMGIKKDLRYDFSVLYRTVVPGIKLHIELLGSKNDVIGTTIITLATSEEWKKAEASFTASATELKGQCRIWLEGNGVLDLDMVSLFPGDTWRQRRCGMRADMVQLLADMKPGFIRFPGGCIVEGFDLSQRYQWKKTVGPIDQRQLIINRWNFEFAHRPAPDYFQTFGLGFFEYFQLAEDIGAEPLPILNCGMACQFNSAEVVPLDQLDPYVQDALDLVEFANADSNSTWGRVRATMGHPTPFNLKFIGIGNENWGPQYIERLKVFQSAIKAKYPSIKLVTSSGTDPNGERFDSLNIALRNMNADLIDEHYYRSPDWFLKNVTRYDNYPRTGSKVFAGEWAAQTDKIASVQNKNNWLGAMTEAAFMTGLERNAEVVHMASYAPLFAHADAWQWTPDLIWVNNLFAYGTPNYYVQKLFSVHKGTAVVPITVNNNVVAGQDSLYASASVDAATKELVIKLVNVSGKPISEQIVLQTSKKPGGTIKQVVLQDDDISRVNSFEQPMLVSPKESVIRIKGKKFDYTIPSHSLTILRIKML